MKKKGWRITVAEAAEYIGAPDAEQLISLARRRDQSGFRACLSAKATLSEISPDDGGNIDFADSSAGAGMLFTTYRHVTIAWSDVKRLARPSAEERIARRFLRRRLGGEGVKRARRQSEQIWSGLARAEDWESAL